MGRVYLVRHGETTSNRDQILQGPRIDASLSDRGERQARMVAAALAAVPIVALYSSPLTRARQTAEAVAGHHPREHLAVQVVPELYEMDYGDFAGHSYDDVRGEMEQVLDAWRLGFVDQPFPGGESALLAQHRIRPFADRLRALATSVAVVAHGRINRVLLATLTGAGLQRLEEFPQANAAITEVELDGDAARVIRLNDTEHLDLASDSFS